MTDSFLDKLKHAVENMNTMPYGEIKLMAQNIDNDVKNEIKRLEDLIEQHKHYYKSFVKSYGGDQPKSPCLKSDKSDKPVAWPSKIPPTIKELETITHKVGNIALKSPVIKSYRDAMNFPWRPCVIPEVKDWWIIAFPDLGQIIPVTYVNNIFEFKADASHTRINFNLFDNIDTSYLRQSNFAVFPYTKSTWAVFNKIDHRYWPDYLRQLNICNINNKKGNVVPLNSTTCLAEISAKTGPEHMAMQWSMFAQLYFILYLFRQVGGKDHFSI